MKRGEGARGKGKLIRENIKKGKEKEKRKGKKGKRKGKSWKKKEICRGRKRSGMEREER